jgi:hypothetical protein
MFVSGLHRLYRLGPVLVAVVPLAALAPSPTTVAAPDLKPGDTWVFDRSTERGTSGFSDQHIDLKVEHVGVDTMVVGIKPDGSPNDFEDHVMGADWSQRRLVDGNQTTTGRPLAFPLEVGKTWTSDYTDPTRFGFHAIKIESDDKIKAHFMAANAAVGGALSTADGATVIAKTNHAGPHTEYAETFSTFYYVPEIKYWVKSVEETYNSENVRTRRQINLLVSFKPGS